MMKYWKLVLTETYGRNKRNVSIKVLAAKQSGEDSYRELRILNHLSGMTPAMEHPGRRYISTLKDHFYVDGPNGRHLCLVMDVIGPTVFFVLEHRKDFRLPAKLAREVSKQLMLAVDHLHQCGIAHGGACCSDC